MTACPCPDKCPLILAQETKIEYLSEIIKQQKKQVFQLKSGTLAGSADGDFRDHNAGIRQ